MLTFLNKGFICQLIVLLVYSSAIISTVGYLALIIASSISLLVSTQKKQLSYASVLIGTILLFSSFVLSFANPKSGLEWWGYFSRVAMGMTFITMTFYTLVDTQRKRLFSALLFITLLLLLVGSILMFLELRNADAKDLGIIIDNLFCIPTEPLPLAFCPL